MEPITQRSAAKPAWLKTRFPATPRLGVVNTVIRKYRLHTVCAEAGCPNRGECWGQWGTATFLILGEECTRNCRFCKVGHGAGAAPDGGEPERLARAAAELGLAHVVITSVTRDDLPDGGAAHFAAVLGELQARVPEATREVLVPDFQGRLSSLDTVLRAGPDIFSHNLETVRRLTPLLRSGAEYDRSLAVLAYAAQKYPEQKTKSSLLLGLGEAEAEIRQALADLRQAGVSMVHLGQYLQPSASQAPVERYYPPAEFTRLRALAQARGFTAVQSGPLVRSSYRAHEFTGRDWQLFFNLRK
jgi:lipoic acid synthetase